MIEGLRAEFPGLFRSAGSARFPGVARAPAIWACICALGAGFMVSAIAQLAVAVVFTLLFPPTSPRPFAFSTKIFWDVAGGVAAGAVATRAGGPRGLLAYVSFELLVVLLELPVRLFSCSRAPSGPIDGRACQYADMVVDRWPLWAAVIVGVVIARFVPTRQGGANPLLRAAGVLSAVVTVATSLNAYWLVFRPVDGVGLELFTYLSVGALYWLGFLAGGVLAGVLLRRSRFAAVVLLILCLIGPSFAFGIPLVRGQLPGLPVMPTPLFLSFWQWAWLPLAASAAILLARVVAQRNRLVSAM